MKKTYAEIMKENKDNYEYYTKLIIQENADVVESVMTVYEEYGAFNSAEHLTEVLYKFPKLSYEKALEVLDIITCYKFFENFVA